MSKINIKESLLNIDKSNYCKYDLTTLYECCFLDQKDKEKLVLMLYKECSAEELYDFLYQHFLNDAFDIDEDPVDELISDDYFPYSVSDFIQDGEEIKIEYQNPFFETYNISAGKIGAEDTIKFLNNILNNPKYKLTDKAKDKIYKNSAPWGLTVKYTPTADIEGTNDLLATGDFSSEASFGESNEIEQVDKTDIEVMEYCPNCGSSRFNSKIGVCIDCGYDEKDWGYTDTDDYDESIAPYKKRELKKQLQDELYNAIIKELTENPKWGYEDLRDIDEYIGLVVEVKDNTGDDDADLIAEVRGEFTYNELFELGIFLNKIISKYDKYAYFEPVTSGITNAYIKIRKNINESIEDAYTEASEHLMDIIDDEVSAEVIDYYIDDFGSEFVITYNNNLRDIEKEATNLSNILTRNGYKIKDWNTNGDNILILEFAKPISLNESIKDDDELISASDWRYVASKMVPDSDGFLTDYTWYENTKDGRHIFIFGDNDLYDDVDSSYADWEVDSYSEAKSWFDNYHGFDEEDM